MAKQYRIALIPGDGIGLEVVPAAVEVLEGVGRKHGIEFRWTEYDWSCDRYVKTGAMMPADGVDQVRPADAILLGAVGYPGVPDHVSLWGLLLPLRRGLRQYACVRPVKLLPGVRTPLADRTAKDIDFIIVRENNEGEYSQMGGRIYEATDDEIVIQENVFTRRGVDRILEYAFRLAEARPRHEVASATKSNGIFHAMPYWDERFRAAADRHPGVRTSQFHVDILAAHLVQHPDWFDVIVGSNLFGDILSDLGAAVAGSMGLAPSANINPERQYPSMFEPVHGSAPDIAGKGVANPVAQIWSGAMMLEHLGHAEAASAVLQAIVKVLGDPASRTRDLGGRANTREATQAILAALPWPPMARRRSASEIEAAAAARSAPPRSRPSGRSPTGSASEALAMLRRRGLTPKVGRRDLPFPADVEGPAADAIAERLGHYAFRLFLRGAILAQGPFRPQDATRYLPAAGARAMADDLVALGLARPEGSDRYRLRFPARNFGGTLEWWVGRELARLGFDVATGVRSGAAGVGGDLDVVAAVEGKLVYVELKSSPPKHLTEAEVAAFLRRVRSLRPHVAIFAVDTALRLSDKVLPLVATVLGPAASPQRLVRDTWRLAGTVYLTNARQDLIENLRAAIADALLTLGPPPP